LKFLEKRFILFLERQKMKRCTKCNEEKDIDEFSLSLSTKDRRSYYCKECCRQYAKKTYRWQNPVRREMSEEEYENYKQKRYLAQKALANEINSSQDSEADHPIL
jgi:hypothetical protein